MLNVSGVNFRGNPILEREGKYSSQPQQAETKTPDMPPDNFEKPKKKNKGLKAFLWTVGVLAAAAIGLGVAVKKGKLDTVQAPAGWLDHTKNFFANIGKGVVKAYDNTVEWATKQINKIRGSKAEDVIIPEEVN